MKISLFCTACSQQNGGIGSNPTLLEVNEAGAYKFTCNQGHQNQSTVQNSKFEILFEIGAHAIVDGYYREAVGSFTSSLERFYEFSLRVLSRHRGIDVNVFQSTWKLIKNQSERQLGAFIISYLQQFNRAPSVLQTNKVEFRNSVIHKGEIPSKQQAIEYGQSVLEIVQLQLLELREVAIKSIHDEIQSEVAEKSKHMIGYPRTNSVAPSIISCIAHPHEVPKLNDIIESEPRFLRRFSIT